MQIQAWFEISTLNQTLDIVHAIIGKYRFSRQLHASFDRRKVDY